MNNFVGISPKYSCIVALISRVIINIHEKCSLVIYVLDHLVNMLYLSINLKPGLYVMQRAACLVLNPITVYSYGFLFNCMMVGQVTQ